MISKEEVLELIDEAIARLPEELRAARWLLKEREEYLARVRHEGDEILEQARARAERMVQRTEVVKAAEQRAYQIVETAESDARRLQHEVEDFCDQKLASFEIVLERTMTLVSAGRTKLQGANLLGEGEAADQERLDQATLPPPPDAAVEQAGPTRSTTNSRLRRRGRTRSSTRTVGDVVSAAPGGRCRAPKTPRHAQAVPRAGPARRAGHLDVRGARPGGEIDVDVELESISSGLVVEGTITAPWNGDCRRCLDAVEGLVRDAGEGDLRAHAGRG